MFYFQRNIGDYRAATPHLSLLEHGVYCWLIDSYYLSEKPLPLDERVLFRQTMAKSEDEKQAVIDILDEFFVKCEDGWHHKRIDYEINEYAKQAEKNRENGKKGGRPRKPSDNPNESEKNPVGYFGKPNDNPNETQTKATQKATYKPNNLITKEPINQETNEPIFSGEQESESEAKQKTTRKKTFRQFLKSRKESGAVSVFDRDSKVYSHLTLQGMPSTMQYIFVFAFRNYYLNTENQKQYADWERQAIAAFDQNYSACRVAYRDSDNVWQLTQTGKNIEVLYKAFSESGKIGVDYE